MAQCYYSVLFVTSSLNVLVVEKLVRAGVYFILIAMPSINVEKFKKKQRGDYYFHQFIKRITESRKFDVAIMLVIFMNTLSMTLDTSYYYREQLKYVIFIADEMFLGMYNI